MSRTIVGLAMVVGLMAACQKTGGFLASRADTPFAPGADPSQEAVDGLTVGHRLMAAGEYQLALDAYHRAAAEQGATVDVLSAIGSADLKLGRLGQAETVLRQALKVDQRFVPAWNNLGVVLMERGKVSEAALTFKTAFALDSGQSDEIRQNLRRALAKLEDPAYDLVEQEEEFTMVRRGVGQYLLLTTQ